jgi:signal transduction histidine kinase
MVAAVCLFRHLVHLAPVAAEPPSPAWLAANYGSAVLLLVVVGAPPPLPPEGAAHEAPHAAVIAVSAYVGIMLALGFLEGVRHARRGTWRPGSLGELRSWDLMVGLMVVPILGGAMLLAPFHADRPVGHSTWSAFFHGLMGLVLVVPFLARFPGPAARLLLTAATTLAAAAVAWVGVRALVPAPEGVEVRRLVGLAAVLGLALALVPGRALLRGAVDRVVFHRSRRERARLQELLHALSPELGVLECCRRTLAELVRIVPYRGAAILLTQDGRAVAQGAIALAPLERAWPTGEAANRLPAHALVGTELRELALPLKEALIEAEVVVVFPVISPRRRWGHLFATVGPMGALFDQDDVQAMEAFVGQLALVLDGADLLARTVAVERSLAHAERLAAIGETAARIAHEIRNPVTAARSLAQQLAREPASPFAAEHTVILGELERIERQVAALLRFARHEDFRFTPVDLGQLVRGTVHDLRSRLDEARITVDVDAADGVVARADRERLRQVLVNLVENAVDALRDADGDRRLVLAVGTTDGRATVRVTDTGPGVAAEDLPHLFEPFFSRKADGTGLGLAIAKRTLDAHGGRIEAASEPGAGTTFRLEVPLAGGATSPR